MKARHAFLLVLTLVLVVGGAGWFWVRQAQRQYALNRQLIAALTKNDTKQALALINTGADPNTRGNPTPAPSLPELLQQFLHHQSPPADDSPTALLIACGAWWKRSNNGDLEEVYVEEDLPLMQAMLQHGADANVICDDVQPVLIAAIFYRDVATIALLLEHGANINIPNSDGMTALMASVFYGDEQKVGFLLAHSPNINAQDSDGSTALRYAVNYTADEDIIEQLLAYGADPNLPNKQGVTPLMQAQRLKRSDIVALLKRSGK